MTNYATIARKLRERDNLQEIVNIGKPAFLHEDHRWILPLLAWKQAEQVVPQPCTLVMFDAHHDSLEPRNIATIREISEQSPSPEQVFDLCDTQLSTSDDDWVIAGMELGLIKDAVVFGVTHYQPTEKHRVFHDSRGIEHQLWMTCALPGESLGFQGDLSDHARSDELELLWSILDWNLGDSGFKFSSKPQPIILDIDLDCFTATWRGSHFSWPAVVWQDTFELPSTYGLTQGWTGRAFFDSLRDRAAMITVAREAACCGGEAVCDENLSKVATHLFGLNEGFEIASSRR